MMDLMTGAAALALMAGAPVDGDTLLTDTYDAKGPGVAALVVDDGETLYAGGVGLADIPGQRAVDPDTAFRFGLLCVPRRKFLEIHPLHESVFRLLHHRKPGFHILQLA